ncbi:MAG: MmgE/PrpD family protein [Methyloligellaceae bacterium]
MSIAEDLHVKQNETRALTKDLANWLAAFQSDRAPAAALTWSKHALLDWLAVIIAGAREPLAEMLIAELAGNGSACTLYGRAERADLLNAALINGATSHALDYDDVNRLLHGHPTVPTLPVALALGEMLCKNGRDVLAAFIAGTEVECALGHMAGNGHYDHGFHATGTMGTFGATAAAAHIMGLDAEVTARAFGIAASQASGLKINFGTMTKPLHAGKAAMNGLLAARLAARGFTASTEAIEAPQGFTETQAPGFVTEEIRPDSTQPFAVEQTLFKYHAACYRTHSVLEAMRDIRTRYNVGLEDMDSMTLHVAMDLRKVCDILEPETGLEIKFAIRHLACMGLDGVDTAALDVYSDQNANAPRYVAARRMVDLEALPAGADRMSAGITLKLKDGRTVTGDANVAVPAKDLDKQWQALTAKFETLTVPIIGREKVASLIEAVDAFDMATDLKGLTVNAVHRQRHLNV